LISIVYVLRFRSIYAIYEYSKIGEAIVTIRQKIIDLLKDCGLIEIQAKIVLEQYISSPDGVGVSGFWDEKIENIPDFFIESIWIGVKKVGANWLDKNLPDHWARRMFG